MPRFVLEIGTEELPPRFFPVVLPQLKTHGEEMLRRARLAFREAKVYGTPRRLALIAEDLAERQAPHTREERGPSAKVAFDAEGKATKAALGFARRLGVDPAALERRETGQGEYVFAVVEEPELAARDALAPLLPGLITGLTFPKTMRWGTGKLRFGRPIRWLLALVDAEVVEFELEGIKSGRLTRGHPVLAEGTFEVNNAREYEEALRKRYVEVDDWQRQEGIKKQLDSIVRDQQKKPVGVRWELLPDPMQRWMFFESVAQQMTSSDGLLMQTTFLAEWPKSALGHFDPSFLKLPRPVLIEEMRHVQCYFPLEDEQGGLLPSFIAVRDGGDEDLGTVVAGWENVLRAKLMDAGYFYEQDLKTPLAQRVESLKGVVFQERLGSMYDKAKRVSVAAAAAAEQDGLSDAECKWLDQAALLCKADLTTEMVTELSGLQGVMGREYARRIEPHEPDEVAEAIGEHYRPRFAGDEIPQSRLGQLLAVADKVDSITACLAVGLTPTGSADPYGLRREAMGVVRILIEGDHSLSVRSLVEAVLRSLYEQTTVQQPREKLVEEVMDFLRQRLEAYLSQGDVPFGRVRYDLVNAALAVGFNNIWDAAQRARALQQETQFHSHDFQLTSIACTRPMNISRGFDGRDVPVAPNLFDNGMPAESALWRAYEQVEPEARCLADQGEYAECLRLVSGLRHLIDTFFDEVLVMDEKEDVRRNRLAMCWQLSQLFRRIADFSLIVQA